ncbi:MAG TPA: DUF1996 domain-containing protein, partial [Gaiellaceae bacterium]|nr:DUF1996 domain-containing protein [Gaiellaceae bacterium]
MPRSLTAGIAFLTLAALAVATPRALADPGWISTCQFSHSAHDDPIVFPEQPGAAHFHDFVAARTTDAFSTTDSLRAGGTTCPMPGDTSAYWIPAAYEDGLQVAFGTSKHALFYYRRKAAPSGVAVTPFPDGLELVVGNGHATSAEDNPALASGKITFKCGPGSNPEAPYPPLACSGGVVVIVFIFPNCWDGFRLDSPDHFSHMAYPVGSLCPSSHPVVVPRIQGFWRYDVGVDAIDLAFSSGGWWTAHTDFFNAWRVSHLQWLLDNCINANLDCGTDPAVPQVDEVTPTISSEGGGDSATLSIPENQTVVTDVDATDPNGDTLTYAITGGSDHEAFAIDTASGEVTFLSAPDFELPTDAGLNNVYDVTVSVSDGTGNADSQAIAVTVTNVNEFAPVIDGGPSASVSVPENQTAATDVNATDGDSDVLTYSLTGGADSGDFTIDPSTGVLTFTVLPDFELPADANTDNLYEVTVTAADASFSDAQAITVEVTDVVEGGGNSLPTITSNGGGPTAAVSAAENQTVVTDVDASDPDAGDTLAYSISGGVDMVAFVIDSGTGALTFLNAPDFELPTDTGMNNVYDLVVTVSDGNGGSDTQAIAVTVTNENEFTPDITSNGGGPTAAVSAAENQTAVTDVDASDGDGQTITYSISGGADAARFAISSSTGVLTFVNAPNFEAPTDVGQNNVYDVNVQASDGGSDDTQAISVAVADVAEGGATILYFSIETAQTLSGIPVTPQDIVAFDGQSYSLFVDGSDVGLDLAAENIDAFALLADGSVLLSTTGNPSLPGISGSRDEDVLALSPGLRGATTTGTWSMYLDGSAVGLEASGEDVDAVELLEDGRLLVSTSGAVSVTGVSGA